MQHYRSRRENSFQERDSEGRFTSSHPGRRYGDYNENNHYRGDDYRQGGRNDYEYEDGRYYRDMNSDRFNDQDHQQYNQQYGRTDGYRDYDEYNRRDYNDYNRNERMREDYDRRDGRNDGRSDGRNGGYAPNGGSHHSDYSNRGFAAMPRSEVRRIASMGGRASHDGRALHDGRRRAGRVSSRRRAGSSR